MRAGPYAELLRVPGAARLATAAIALGVGATMTPVALVLFARQATHSFGSASLVLAASTAGGLALAPLRGRLVDRAGPRAAVVRLALPSAVTDAAFIVGGRAHVAVAALVALALVSGAVTAPAAAALRTVWAQTVATGERRQAAYALTAMLQEVSFVTGPVLAGGVIALFSPTAAVVVSAGLALAGALMFAVTSAARRAGEPAGEDSSGRLGAIAGAGMRTVLASAAGFGLAFGVLDVALPAFARAHGSAATAGILLSALAAGIGAGSFAYGLRRSPSPAGRRYPPLCLVAAAGLAPLMATPALGIMVALAFAGGLCFAPVTACQIAILDEVAPAGRRAEALTWIGTLYGAGSAAGAALAGQLVDRGGTRPAFAAACAAALAAWAVAAARAGTLVPAEPGDALSGRTRRRATRG